MGRSRLFISYAHGTSPSADRVRGVAEQLQHDGFEVAFDQFVIGAGPGFDWPSWMESRFREADLILVVGSEAWQRRYELREYEVGRGASWEGSLIRAELYDTRGINRRFIPIVMDDAPAAQVLPLLLRVYGYYRLDQDYELLKDFLAEPDRGPGLLGPVRRDPGTPSGSMAMVMGAVPHSTRTYVDTGVLEQVETALRTTPRRPVVISGEPGAGKTQAAAEIVARRWDRMRFTLWIDASSELSMRDGLRAFVREVAPRADDGSAELLEEVRAGLDRLGPALIVLDDLYDHAVLQRLRPLANCDVVVTSRHQPSHTTCASIRLRPLTEQESVQLVGAVTGRDDDYAALVRELAGIPLVLQQAAQYMKAANIRPADYLERLRTELLLVADRHYGDDDQRTHTIRASLNMSIAGANGLAPSAAPIFELVSLFGEHSLQRDTVRTLLGMVDVDRMTIDEALAALERFTIVRYQGDVITSPPLFLSLTRAQCAAERYRAAALAWARSFDETLPVRDSRLYSAMGHLVLGLDLSFEARVRVLEETSEAEGIANWRVLAKPVLDASLRLITRVDEPLLALAIARKLFAAFESMPTTHPWIVETQYLLTSKVAWFLKQCSRLDEALATAQDGVRRAKTLDAKKYVAHSLDLLGNVELERGSFESALAAADAALAADPDSSSLDRATTLDLRAKIRHRLAHRPGNADLHALAMKDILEANRLREVFNHPESIALGKHNMASLLACIEFPSDITEAFGAAADAFRFYRDSRPAQSSEVAATLRVYAALALRRAFHEDTATFDSDPATVALHEEIFRAIALVLEARATAGRFDLNSGHLSQCFYMLAVQNEDRLVRAQDIGARIVEVMANADCRPDVFLAVYGNMANLARDPTDAMRGRLERARTGYQRVTGLDDSTFEKLLQSAQEGA